MREAKSRASFIIYMAFYIRLYVVKCGEKRNSAVQNVFFKELKLRQNCDW